MPAPRPRGKLAPAQRGRYPRIGTSNVRRTRRVWFDPRRSRGLVAWYRADGLLGSLADSAAVATWPDSSGNGNHLAQGTADNRPLFKTAVKAGQPAILFDGSNDVLSVANPLTGLTTLTAFLVFQRADTVASRVLANVDGTANVGLVLFSNVSDRIQMSHSATGDLWSAPGTGWFVISLDIDVGNDTSHLWGNGTLRDSDSAVTTALTINDADLFIGATDAAGTSPHDSHIAEIIFYNRILATTERVNLERWLGAKYGITVA